MIKWELKCRELANCNCAYGCPCQFNALPTDGTCRAIVGFDISEGYFGATRFDGLRAVAIMSWPGAIHEGRGQAQIIVDERANDDQRTALLTILSGQETEPGKTVWNVFAATLEKVFDPLFLPIDIAIDVEARRGHIRVPGMIEVEGEPIRNPVTGAEHRVRIDIPDGFEYTIAEMGSGSSTVQGPLPLTLRNSYAQFAHLHLNQSGVVHTKQAA